MNTMICKMTQKYVGVLQLEGNRLDYSSTKELWPTKMRLSASAGTTKYTFLEVHEAE